MKIVTFNILSKKLVVKYPPYNPPREFTPEFHEKRLLLIQEKLLKHIKSGAIICLQEVDAETSFPIQKILKENNYDFYYHPYAGEPTGYMGIAICVPSNVIIRSLDRFQLAEGKKWPKFKVSLWRRILNRMTFGFLNYTKMYQNWFKYQFNKQFQLSIQVEKDGKLFWVSTVHIPADFKMPSSMITYIGLARQHIESISNGLPYVLGGDFNTEPKTPYFPIITDGTCDYSTLDKDYPPEDKWRPSSSLVRKLKSAVEGIKWTDFTVTGKSTYKGVIDHILVTEEFKVLSYSKNELPEITCPNDTEPSDHIDIWAEIALK